MLKLIVRPSNRGALIKLEGALTGRSVQALAQLWTRIRSARLHAGTRLDVAALRAIDSRGARLLQQMRRDGADVPGAHA